MHFLPLTEPNPTNSLKEVKVSQQTDTKKCDQVSSSSSSNNNNNNNNKWKAIPIQAPWAAGGCGSQNF
jgi:hypothetical protein